jgi:hypothetical protein
MSMSASPAPAPLPRRIPVPAALRFRPPRVRAVAHLRSCSVGSKRCARTPAVERVECRVGSGGLVTSHSLSSSTGRCTRGRRCDEAPLPLPPPPAPPGSAPAAPARQARQCRAVPGPRRLGHHAAQPRPMFERRNQSPHGPLPVPCFTYVRDVRGGGSGDARWEALERTQQNGPQRRVSRLLLVQLLAYVRTAVRPSVQPSWLMSSLILRASVSFDAPADNECNVETQCRHQGPQGPRVSVPTGSNTRPSSLQRLFASPSPPHTPPLPLEARATNALESRSGARVHPIKPLRPRQRPSVRPAVSRRVRRGHHHFVHLPRVNGRRFGPTPSTACSTE